MSIAGEAALSFPPRRPETRERFPLGGGGSEESFSREKDRRESKTGTEATSFLRRRGSPSIASAIGGKRLWTPRIGHARSECIAATRNSRIILLRVACISVQPIMAVSESPPSRICKTFRASVAAARAAMKISSRESARACRKLIDSGCG